VHVIGLLLVEVGLRQEAAEADDAVPGCSNLVADVCEEFDTSTGSKKVTKTDRSLTGSCRLASCELIRRIDFTYPGKWTQSRPPDSIGCRLDYKTETLGWARVSIEGK
jgi:hypothetical protein